MLSPTLAAADVGFPPGLLPSTNLGDVASAPLSRRNLGVDWIVPAPLAAGDGATDDTAALQAVLNSLTAGQVMGLRAGATYCASGLSIPMVGDSSRKMGIVALGGTATIKACTGTPDYIIANRNWIQNSPFAAWPTYFENITFDGNGRAAVGQYDVAFSSVFKNVHWIKATGDGQVLADTTQNGTPLVNTTQNNLYIGSDASENGRYGLHNAGHHTDAQVFGGWWHDNASYQFYMLQTAGWLIQGTHSYNFLASGKNMAYFADYGFNTNVSGNIFEGAVEIYSLNATTRDATFGPDNTLTGSPGASGEVDLTFGGVNASSGPVTLRSVHNNLQGNARLVLNYNHESRTIISDGDTFDLSQPYVWLGGSLAQGNIVAHRSYSRSSAFNDRGMLDGLQIPSGAIPVGSTRIERLKTLDASGTTTLTLVGTVQNFDAAGFSIEGSVDVFVNTTDSSTIESYTADIRASYVRQFSGTGSASKAEVVRSSSTGSNVTISSITLSDATDASGPNTATLTITISHPEPQSLASRAMLDLRIKGRQVSGWNAS